MRWENVKNLRRFTPLKEVFAQYGKPKFKLGSRPVYYMGNGCLLSYSTRKIDVNNSERVEYGEEGEYALSFYFFTSIEEISLHFKLKNEQYEFETKLSNSSFLIVDDLPISSTFDHVLRIIKKNKLPFVEGETRALKDGQFSFQNKYIQWNNFTLMFFGNSKETPLTAFDFVFYE